MRRDELYLVDMIEAAVAATASSRTSTRPRSWRAT
jgi:hypothetical protein